MYQLGKLTKPFFQTQSSFWNWLMASDTDSILPLKCFQINGCLHALWVVWLSIPCNKKEEEQLVKFKGSWRLNGEKYIFFHIKQISSFKFWMLLVLIKNKMISFRCKSLLHTQFWRTQMTYIMHGYKACLTNIQILLRKPAKT